MCRLKPSFLSPFPHIYRSHTPSVATQLRSYQQHRHRAPQRLRCAFAQITSPQNPRIKATKQLLRRRQRDKEGLILLEGPRLINDALSANTQVIEIFHTSHADADIHGTILSTVTNRGAKVTEVSESVMRSFSDTVTPQGLMAVVKRPGPNLPISPSFALICDNIRDPGNLGTLLRSAAGAGADAVLLTAGCADVWSLKTLRSGMGAQFRIPLKASVQWDEVERYCNGMKMFIADGDGTKAYTDVDWCGRSALVVGSEADGPSQDAFQLGKGVRIDMDQGLESLNAAMAGTVILFEARRQRSLAIMKS